MDGKDKWKRNKLYIGKRTDKKGKEKLENLKEGGRPLKKKRER